MALSTPAIAFGIGRLSIVLCLALVMTGAVVARAQQDERAVRAAYLFNLSKYVSWPRDAKELRICSEGDEYTGQLLKQILDGKNSDGRMVRVVLDPAGTEQRRCAILYFGNASTSKSDEVLRELGTSPVLTVSDDPQFVRRGGMVGLVRAEDQIQLHVNISAVRLAGIQMSSRLLSIAVIVHAGGRK